MLSLIVVCREPADLLSVESLVGLWCWRVFSCVFVSVLALVCVVGDLLGLAVRPCPFLLKGATARTVSTLLFIYQAAVIHHYDRGIIILIAVNTLLTTTIQCEGRDGDDVLAGASSEFLQERLDVALKCFGYASAYMGCLMNY